MAKKDDTKIVQVLHWIVGLDVHKETVAACLIMQTDTGEQIEQREFCSFRDLRRLKRVVASE